jgi:hypothetical protein
VNLYICYCLFSCVGCVEICHVVCVVDCDCTFVNWVVIKL